MYDGVGLGPLVLSLYFPLDVFSRANRVMVRFPLALLDSFSFLFFIFYFFTSAFVGEKSITKNEIDGVKVSNPEINH